jgi:hypothetical protein
LCIASEVKGYLPMPQSLPVLALLSRREPEVPLRHFLAWSRRYRDPALTIGPAPGPQLIVPLAQDQRWALTRGLPHDATATTLPTGWPGCWCCCSGQLALAILIETGRYDRHLRRMRTEYATRRDILVQTLAQHAPAVRLTGMAAGFHAVAHLPAGTAEHAMIRAARSRSVGLYGMSTYRADHCPDPPQLVLGFGNTSQQAIRTGIAVLGDVLTKGR